MRLSSCGCSSWRSVLFKTWKGHLWLKSVSPGRPFIANTQLKQRVSAQSESFTRYSHSAQDFQQFQVLLQRFVENEPFQESCRTEQFARARILLPKLLHVPSVQGIANEAYLGIKLLCLFNLHLGSDSISLEEEADLAVLASDLLQLIESSVLTYRSFIKMDKRRSNGVRNLFGRHNQTATTTPLQQVHAVIDKKKWKPRNTKWTFYSLSLMSCSSQES